MKTSPSYIFIVKVVFLAVVVLLGTLGVPFAVTVEAAFNPQINYQGKLADQSGTTVADGTYAMEFNLYTAASGGTPIWTETRSGADEVEVTKGLFSVMLGEVNALSGIDWNQTLYLGVTIESDDEMTPRKKLGAVPAAMVSDTLDGLESSQFVRSDTANATNTTNTALILTQNGTGDLLNLFDGSDEVFSVLDGGNVGIGTSSPYAHLSVMHTSGGSNPLFIVASSTSGAGTSTAFVVDGYGRVGIGTTTPNEFFVVEKNQNTNTRASFINSSTGTSASVQMLLGNGYSFSDSVRFTVMGTGATTFEAFKQDGAALSAESNLSGGLSIIARGSSADLRLYAGGSGDSQQHLTVKSTGNVGIGTSSPYAKLSVNGTIVGANIISTTTATSTFGGGIDLASGCFAVNGTCISGGGSSLSGGSLDTFAYWTSGSTLGATSSPTVGYLVATSSTASQLPFASSTLLTITNQLFFNSGSIKESGSGGIEFWYNNNIVGRFGQTGDSLGIEAKNNNASGKALAVIQSDAGGYALHSTGGVNYFGGNIGIGTTSPYRELSVVGSAYISSDLLVEGNLDMGGGNISNVDMIQYVKNIQVNDGVTSQVMDITSSGIFFDSGSITGLSSLTLGSDTITDLTGTGLTVSSGALSVSTSTLGITSSQWTTASSDIYYGTGNVGIGTSSPYAKLSVNGTIVGANIISTTTATSTFGGGIDLASGCFAVNGTCISGGGSSQWTTASSDIYYNTGNVGIGSTTPAYKLAVQGSGGSPQFYVYNTTGITSAVFRSRNNGGNFSNTAGIVITNDAASNNRNAAIGFGVGNVTDVAGGSVLLNAITTDATNQYGHFAIGTRDSVNGLTEKLRITDVGYIGIGTTTPAVKLSVGQGDALIDGFVKASYFIGTSTATSTLGGGINITSGCFAISGTCVGGSASQWTTSGSNIYYNTGNVGIGTSSPYAKLSVNGTIVAANIVSTTSATSTFAGDLTVGDGVDGDSPLQVGIDANAWTVGYKVSDKSFRISSSTDIGTNSKFVLLKNGNAGIGDTSPDFALDVYGTICQDTDSNDTCDGTVSSDARLKKDVFTIENSLDLVKQLRGVRFNWRQDVYPASQYGTSTQIGFIAQEVETILPEVVFQDSLGYKMLDYQKLTAVLANAVGELDQKVNTMAGATTSATLATDIHTEQQANVGDEPNATTTQMLVDKYTELVQQVATTGERIDDLEEMINALDVRFNNIATTTYYFSFGTTTSTSTYPELNSETIFEAASQALSDLAWAMISKVQNFAQIFTNKLVSLAAAIGDLFVTHVVVVADGDISVPRGKDQIAGKGVIVAGSSEVFISNKQVDEFTVISITPTSRTEQPLYVAYKQAGKGFAVKAAQPAERNITFDWLMIKTYDIGAEEELVEEEDEEVESVIGETVIEDDVVSDEPSAPESDDLIEPADQPEASEETADTAAQENVESATDVEAETVIEEASTETEVSEEPADTVQENAPTAPDEPDGSNAEPADTSHAPEPEASHDSPDASDADPDKSSSDEDSSSSESSSSAPSSSEGEQN